MNTRESSFTLLSAMCSDEVTSGHSRDKVSLELVQIDVEGSVETKRRCDARDNLGNDSVQVGETWLGNTKVLLADIVNGFVVNLITMSTSNCRNVIVG